MKKVNEFENKDEATLSDEIRQGLYKAYRNIADWMRPSDGHPWPLKIVVFILKLPVLLLILLLSPVIIIILVFVFLTAV